MTANRINLIPWVLRDKSGRYRSWEKLDSMRDWDRHKGTKELRIILNGRYVGAVPRYSKSRIDKIIEDSLP